MQNPLEAVPIDQLRTRTSMKWRYFEPDVLPMWVAEMDVVPADAVRVAIESAVRSGDTGYPHGSDYAEAIARFSTDRWGFTPDVSRSMTVADVMMGIVELLRLLTDSGDEVIVTSPVYPPFHAFTEYADRVVREAPLTAEGRLDPGAIDDACAQATAGGRRAVLLLANPHNPTGTVHTRDELAEVAGIAARHGVRVIADEIHAPLVYGDRTFTPYLAVDPRGFQVISASKAWNLAGIRSAVIVAGPEADELARVPEVVTHGPSLLAIRAHVAALDDGRDWLDALLTGLDANRRLLADLLAEQAPTVGYRVPEATFLAWLDMRQTAIADPAARSEPGFVGLAAGPSLALRDRARLGVNAGESFGAGGENHVRLNFGTRQDLLRAAVRRIASVV